MPVCAPDRLPLALDFCPEAGLLPRGGASDPRSGRALRGGGAAGLERRATTLVFAMPQREPCAVLDARLGRKGGVGRVYLVGGALGCWAFPACLATVEVDGVCGAPGSGDLGRRLLPPELHRSPQDFSCELQAAAGSYVASGGTEQPVAGVVEGGSRGVIQF